MQYFRALLILSLSLSICDDDDDDDSYYTGTSKRRA